VFLRVEVLNMYSGKITIPGNSQFSNLHSQLAFMFCPAKCQCAKRRSEQSERRFAPKVRRRRKGGKPKGKKTKRSQNVHKNARKTNTQHHLHQQIPFPFCSAFYCCSGTTSLIGTPPSILPFNFRRFDFRLSHLQFHNLFKSSTLNFYPEHACSEFIELSKGFGVLTFLLMLLLRSGYYGYNTWSRPLLSRR